MCRYLSEWWWPLFDRDTIHHCPVCGHYMVIKCLRTVYRAGAKESEGFPVGDPDGPYPGQKVWFSWREFHCGGCGKWYDITRFKAYEKSLKRKKSGKRFKDISISACISKRHNGPPVIEKRTYDPTKDI